MRWAISTLRSAVLAMPTSSMVSAMSAAPCSTASGATTLSLSAAGLEVDRVDDRAARDLLQREPDDVGLGRVDLDRRGLGQRDALDRLAHLLVLVLALGERDADVEHVRAALDLVLGDLHAGRRSRRPAAAPWPCASPASSRARRRASARGSCTSGVAVIIELETCGGRGAGRAPARAPARSARAIAAMCSGVVPQQPPTIETP